ncbi:DNA primase [Butyrivibrio sp. MC2013]|uniref:DNA primase n=1 Tax=Butyrivibrio sp. MC2013 TaxID=1280686 RepID=UPI000411632B|nr:DNA primase [Butyrivibrio sp. MC2013]
MYYSPDIIDEVRSRNDIVDVVGQYVHLEKKGNNYFGLCPFHTEKTGSFSVSPTKQIFYCFGCGAGGNVFAFLQRYNSQTFGEALKELADRGGVKLPDEDDSPEARERRSKRQTLLEINKEAARFYFHNLKGEHGKQGLSYFAGRKLSKETIIHFGLGYAGIGGTELVQHLRSKGFKDDMIIESGLAAYDEKRGIHDSFWNRVMFPILDINQKVIGFGGRVLGDAKPKYLNSPENPVFNKRRNLYGLAFAKNSKAGNIILCEGYMDVIAMHQAGFTQAVASLGTAFTSEQAALLKRFTSEVILSYDSDQAGTKAALRNMEILEEAGIRARILNLEPYKDPDEFIKAEGSEAFGRRIREAEIPFFYEVRIMMRDGVYDMNNPERKTEFYREVARKLCRFTEPLERDNYTAAIASRLGIPVADLRSMVISVAAAGLPERKKTDPVREKPQKNLDPAELVLKSQRLLLTWLADEPQLYQTIRRYISADDFTDDLYRQVADRMFRGIEAGRFSPAQVMSLFPELEDQEKVAAIFNTNLVHIETKGEKEKAFHDIIYDVCRAAYDKKTKELSLSDANALKIIVEGKKKLQELAHTRISLDD